MLPFFSSLSMIKWKKNRLTKIFVDLLWFEDVKLWYVLKYPLFYSNVLPQAPAWKSQQIINLRCSINDSLSGYTIFLLSELTMAINKSRAGFFSPVFNWNLILIGYRIFDSIEKYGHSLMGFKNGWVCEMCQFKMMQKYFLIGIGRDQGHFRNVPNK